MKRYLVIGCAAAALCTAAGSASAQTKFNVLIGGDAFFQFGYVDQDKDQGLRSTEAMNRFRLNITPTAKADNGLEYGARVRLRASNGNGTIDADRAYIFAEGQFGRVQAGTDAGASDNYAFIGPVVDWGTFGAADGWWMSYLGPTTGGNIPLSTQGQLRTLGSSDANTRITYLTPSFSGLQLIASYAPVTGPANSNYGSANTAVSRAKNTSVGSESRAEGYNDVYEIGAVYTGEFSGVTIEGSAFYSGGQAKNDVVGLTTTRYEDLSSWQAGLQLGYAGFKVGGSYSNSYDSGYVKVGRSNSTDQETIIAGLQYTTGPIVVGASYTYAQDAGDFDATGKNKLNLYSVGANYTVAPGLTVGLEYNYFDLNHNVSANDDKGSVVIFDTRVAF
ncbi:putative porin [Azospirillum fermentarium]|uniref:porin n=1 Tax=Azospirillum fermentarium TaxID=1233114 RepID=UPI002227D1D5|nr:porin [Azospirillum fermentarium]MCW2245224.1 putative porin [Azospirillum fermentarium]